MWWKLILALALLASPASGEWFAIEHGERCAPYSPVDTLQRCAILNDHCVPHDVVSHGVVVETTIEVHDAKSGYQVTFYRGEERCRAALAATQQAQAQTIKRYR